MSFAEVNGIKICYEIHGSGEPIFLMEGFGAKKELWIAQIGALSEHFKVIIFDNRGTGKSDRPNEPYTMEIFADDINGLMNFLGIEKAHIVGKSLGGMIAQNFAIIYPHRVNKLVLMNTFPSMTPPGVSNEKGVDIYRRGRITEYEAVLEDPVKAFYELGIGGFSRSFRKLLKEDPKRKFHGIFSAEDLIKENTIDPCTPQDINNFAYALAHHNTYDRLHEIKNETLIIYASKDKAAPKIMGEKLHELIPNSILRGIENAGHASNLEKAPEVNKILINFLLD
jgi:3-oxoadipate enol-lactonase